MTDEFHDLEALAALADGKLGAAERQRVMAHVADCRHCRETLAELGRAMADGTLQGGQRSTGGRFGWTRIGLPVAASVLLAAFVGWQLQTWWPGTAGSGSSAPSGADPASTEAGSTDDDLLRKRSAGRKVAGKTFTMSGGEWIDTALDTSLELPSVTVRGAQEREELLARVPELAPYAALGSRVTVQFQGKIYRFEP